MADGLDDDMTRCPCCDGEGYFYHGDEPKSPWGDAATIARLTAERDEARARIAVMVHPQARDPDGAVALDDHVKRAVDAETRACAATVSKLRDGDNQVDEAIARYAIIGRIAQRKEEGKP